MEAKGPAPLRLVALEEEEAGAEAKTKAGTLSLVSAGPLSTEAGNANGGGAGGNAPAPAPATPLSPDKSIFPIVAFKLFSDEEGFAVCLLCFLFPGLLVPTVNLRLLTSANSGPELDKSAGAAEETTVGLAAPAPAPAPTEGEADAKGKPVAGNGVSDTCGSWLELFSV